MAPLFLLTVSADTQIFGENSFCKLNEEIIIDIFNMQGCDKIHFPETFQTAYSYTPILELENSWDRSSQPGGDLNEWNSHRFHTLGAGAEDLP